MVSSNNAIDLREPLKELYRQNPVARVMLEEFASRERDRSVTRVDRLLHLSVGNRAVDAHEIRDVFKKLEELGCGSLVIGRRGHPTRFEWRLGLVGVGRTAVGEDVPLDVVSPPAEALPVDHWALDDSADDGLNAYTFPLRPTLRLSLRLPLDLTANEASRLADFIKSLPFDRNPEK